MMAVADGEHPWQCKGLACPLQYSSPTDTVCCKVRWSTTSGKVEKLRRNSLCSTVFPFLVCSGLCLPPALPPGPSWCWGLPSSYGATSAHSAKRSCNGCANANTISEAWEQISVPAGWEMGISAKDCQCFKSEAAVPTGQPLLQLHAKKRAIPRAVF